MAAFDVRHVLDIKALLGECPLWSEEQQALIWLDIRSNTLNRFDPLSGKNRAWPLPVHHPGSFTLCAGAVAIATCEGLYRFDFAQERYERIFDVPIDATRFRFNDGKADRQGRFWIGSMSNKFRPDMPGEGTYYRFEAGHWSAVIPGIKVPNGTAFSPDGTRMYRAESMDRVIFVYDYDPATGTPSNERVFAEMPEGFGIPDGATVDSEGGLWLAIPFGETGKIARFMPDGKLDIRFDVPVLVPSMVAFGGSDMATLFITTGRIEALMNRPASALGGDIFAVETGFKGVAETLTPL